MRLNALMLLLGVTVLLAGCERTFRDMYDQPRYQPLASSSLWPDGRSARPIVPGTVARNEGTFAGTSSGRLGTIAPEPQVSIVDAIRPALRPDTASVGAGGSTFTMPPLTAALLARGRERFDIFCSPCHSVAGDGDGMIARRGFPHPPSFHTRELREASDAHFFAVMTYGYGAMHSYATRVPASDRIAIIAYIRALQLSQNASIDRLDASDRAQLQPAGATSSRTPR
ncbi:MAG TPA: cytochrome c [Casimicrobiaceae bacterium]|nr:cytochrome c [Casimicrobiaceae bacterium]